MLEFINTNLGTLVAVLLFGLYGLVWKFKKLELKKTAGVDPDVMSKAQKPIQKYFGFLGKTLPILLLVILIGHLSFMPFITITERLFGIDTWINELVGAIIGIIGLLICRLAQVTIGKSWRVGIDEEARPGLVTNGLYHWVRNPTYSGLYILCIGVFVVLPTLSILYWISLFFILMEFQVRCEEEYLETIYGDDYRKYLKTSKRYIPFLW